MKPIRYGTQAREPVAPAAPIIRPCVRCKKNDPKTWYVVVDGGWLCTACEEKMKAEAKGGQDGS